MSGSAGPGPTGSRSNARLPSCCLNRAAALVSRGSEMTPDDTVDCLGGARGVGFAVAATGGGRLGAFIAAATGGWPTGPGLLPPEIAAGRASVRVSIAAAPGFVSGSCSCHTPLILPVPLPY